MKISAKTIKRLRTGALLLWLILVIPTVTIGSDSVKWVNIMSVYAIIVGHLAGLGAARIERNEEKKMNRELKVGDLIICDNRLINENYFGVVRLVSDLFIYYQSPNDEE